MRSFVSSIVLSSLVVACGGAVGEQVRPPDYTGTAAVGGPAPKCGGEAKPAKPLAIDLDPDARVALEAQMQKGVVVVAYDCASIKVLPTCKLAGNYEYAGVSRQERVVQLKSKDEVSLAFPFSGGKVGTSIESGRSIDVALVYVGQRSTTVDKALRSELTGSCDGATHFLQQATLGAFAMSKGSVGKAAAVGDLFGVGAAGASESSRAASERGGALDSCRTSDPDAPKPPGECRLPISLQLVPFEGAKPAVAKAEAKDEKEKGQGAAPKVEATACPTGFVFANGICTKDAVAHVCDPTNAAECKAECDKGSGESCFNAAAIKGTPTAEKRALYKKACDAGHANGCGFYGFGVWLDENNPAKQREGVALAKKGCDAGGAQACTNYALVAWDMHKEKGVAPDQKGALRALERACSLGDPDGCYFLADRFVQADGVAKDDKKAMTLLERGCDGGDLASCMGAAEHAADPSFSLHDDSRALNFGMKACTIEASACEAPIALMVKMGMVGEAAAFAKGACERDPWACESLADLYADGKGVPKDPKKARELYKKACDANNSTSCPKAEGGAAASKKPATKPARKKR